MAEITLPFGWQPRDYQLGMWSYLESGGKYAYQIAHRRWGKDDVSLHRTACAAFERVGSYWHLLPEAAHARKAIWTAVNPHTGRRRIDEAFPEAIRKTTREQEMFIEFVNGSTWQVGGSDRYNTLVGSSPAGVVFSEWALAHPAAWAYVRPILLENGGWVIFITTPRGHNHAERMLRAAQARADAWAEISDHTKTGRFTPEQLEKEKRELVNEYGEEYGLSMFEQEYECSFEAALLGAYYGRWIAKIRLEGRLTRVPVDNTLPVHFAFDLGRSDDTSIWAFQVPWKAIHVCGFHTSNGHDVAYYIKWIRRWLQERGATLGNLYLPHDAKAKTLISSRSAQEQFANGTEDEEGNPVEGVGWDKVDIVPNLSIQDGIQAVRRILPRCFFDTSCDDHGGLDALSQYQREVDEKNSRPGQIMYRDTPLHNWSSHPADAFRMLAVAYEAEKVTQPKPEPRYPQQMTVDEIIARHRAKRLEMEDA